MEWLMNKLRCRPATIAYVTPAFNHVGRWPDLKSAIAEAIGGRPALSFYNNHHPPCGLVGANNSPSSSAQSNDR